MQTQIYPTKGNLLTTKKSLSLAQLGYELLDRKRNILIHEMMTLIETAKSIRGQIESTFDEAYGALQNANITLGSETVSNISKTFPIETGVIVSYRSVMGVEIPHVTIKEQKSNLSYGLFDTNSQLDNAYLSFNKAKKLIVVLAEIDNCVYRLADAIKKTGRRANALQNIVIPRFNEVIKFITNSLEEKEREEFARLKVIKSSKELANKKQSIKHKNTV